MDVDAMTHLNKIYHITGSASQYLQAVMILHQVSQSSSLSEMDHYLLYAGIEDLPDLNHWATRNKVSIPTAHKYELKGQNGLDLSRLQYEIAHRLDEETEPVALVAYGTSVVSYCAAPRYV